MSRTRITDERSRPVPVSYTHTNTEGETSSYQYSDKLGSDPGIYRVMVDDSNPNNRKRMRSGQIVLNDCQISNLEWKHQTSSFMVGPFDSWGSTSVKGDYGPWLQDRVPEPSIPNWSNDLVAIQGLALTEAYARVDSADMLTGEFLGSLGETVGMLKSPFRGTTRLIRKMIKSKRRRLNKSGSNVLNASADAWLEHCYGWKPLLMDISAIMQMSHRLITKDFKGGRRIARASKNLKREASESFEVIGSIPYVDTVTGTVTLTRKSVAHAGVIYQVDDKSPSQAIAQSLGLRLSDVPATAWEMIPFSFVADWFANTGSWINSVVPKPGVKTLGNWVTTIEDYTLSLHGMQGSTTIGTSPPSTSTFPVGGSDYIRNYYTRSCNQPRLATPILDPTGLSIPNQITAAALSVGSITRKLRLIRH